MSNQPTIRLVRENPTPKLASVLLETLRNNARLPVYPMTLQFCRQVRGTYVTYRPANPLAGALCEFARYSYVRDEHLDELRRCGFSVEVRG